MSGTISREKAIATVFRMHDSCDTYDITDYRDMMVEAMKVLPSAQPESSAWVNARDGHDGHVKCKACCKTYDWDSEAQYFNFCPNCGADMRGEKDV